ncbi:MAG: hypothetical protein H6822_25935 [Planctomycetaceae bacterium]|nr:hypothetical protein [Planctomycetaceae bacterium]
MDTVIVSIAVFALALWLLGLLLWFADEHNFLRPLLWSVLYAGLAVAGYIGLTESLLAFLLLVVAIWGAMLVRINEIVADDDEDDSRPTLIGRAIKLLLDLKTSLIGWLTDLKTEWLRKLIERRKFEVPIMAACSLLLASTVGGWTLTFIFTWGKSWADIMSREVRELLIDGVIELALLGIVAKGLADAIVPEIEEEDDDYPAWPLPSFTELATGMSGMFARMSLLLSIVFILAIGVLAWGVGYGANYFFPAADFAITSWPRLGNTETVVVASLIASIMSAVFVACGLGVILRLDVHQIWSLIVAIPLCLIPAVLMTIL